ncbi:hypothetical protein PFISCL1PPCAC_16576, partial [Pristionchus fissidentatus]
RSAMLSFEQAFRKTQEDIAAAGGASKDSFTFANVEEAIDARKRDERFADCKEINRKLFVPGPLTRAYSEQEVANLRAQMKDLQVYPCDEENPIDIPAPFVSFEEAFHNKPDLLAEIKKAGLVYPSPVQCQVWPILLNGIDTVGVSQTGSGKTLAFLLPAFLHLDEQLKLYGSHEKQPCPSVLVLTPTRELAQQIKREVDKYSYNGYKSVCLYGGGSRREQVNECVSGVHIVIATPGRLGDLACEGVVQLNTVSYAVLDEADRMLDMGFEPSIKKIMFDIRPDRLVCLTSATWPPGVRALARRYTKSAAMCVVGSLDLTACNTVTQYVESVDGPQEKKQRLIEIVYYLNQAHQNNYKMIVFVSAKVMADDLSSDLCRAGINSQAMHGSRSQQDRENVLKSFVAGEVRILIATDLASRGIDVPDVTHVVNFDFPSEIEEYVHRIGRTGRAGRSGEAMSFMARRDWDRAQKLIDIMSKNPNNVIPDFVYDMAQRYAAKAASGTLRPRQPFNREKKERTMGY